jgi:hypothetical protein
LPALLLLYVFLGPIFGCVVATLSWSYADEAAQAGQAISNRASKRALLVSGATLCVLVLATAVALGFKRMFS